MIDVLSFDKAISDSEQFSKRHLLLGNGFSIACCPDIFHYGSLFSKADFSSNPKLIEVFEALGTQDFEIAIHNLESGAKLLPIYAASTPGAASEMLADAAALKEILLTTIAGNHPNIPAEISDTKFWACRRFLEFFLGTHNDGQVYTLNYDLLLYWTLMHEDMPFGDAIELGVMTASGMTKTMQVLIMWCGKGRPPHTRQRYIFSTAPFICSTPDMTYRNIPG